MADVQDANAGAEPSMEEILASIRRIIADEKDPNEKDPAPQDGDTIELTQIVQDDGSVASVDEVAVEPPTAPEPAPEQKKKAPEPAPEPTPEPMPQTEETLVSAPVADATASALSNLAHTLEGEKKPVMSSVSPLGNGGRTLEDIVMELMKPILKTWLDENLPPIVEKVVQKEVERIARRIQN